MTTAATALAVGVLAACAPSTGGAQSSSVGVKASGSAAPNRGTVVLVTHDSWAAPKNVLADFTRRTGYRVQVQTNGDVGELTNKLVLTKSSPLGDAVFGIDNTFASRAVDAGVLAPQRFAEVPGAARFDPPAAIGKDLTPVDYGDVCVNVDDAWFARHHRREPTGLADLAKPAFKNLFVTPGAATSSPGLAFLLTTIARYGDTGWQAYWKALVANGIKVDSGWDDAWGVDYTAGGGPNGTRPIVLSYASSIPDTIPKGASRPTTHALLNTCFRQVEYAGVLAGAQNPKGAAALVGFLRTREFQQSVPANMYVYPVNSTATLPKTWARWAKVAAKPYSVPAQQIASKRTAWLQQWSAIVTP